MYELKLKHKFSAAHHLENYNGACANVHGHTWSVLISIKTNTLVNDMVVDFKELKALIDGRYDHKDINKQVVFNPTAEHISGDIYSLVMEYLREKSAKAIPQEDRYVVKVTVWEAENASITYTGVDSMSEYRVEKQESI
jgi:6-pyruvoyltetrahydropterin/6-carboxytetrahydropterin synthase